MKSRIVFGPVIAACLYAAYWSVRLAYADHLASSVRTADVAEAARVAPLNAAYWLRWADVAAAAAEPASEALTRAAQVSRYDSGIWIRLGIDAEKREDYANAERCFLRSAAIDRTYLPCWTLANYYLRRNDPEHFWPWVKRALERSYGDPTPLFQFCWIMSQDAPVILDRGIPERRPILRRYLAFLLANGRLDAAVTISQRLQKEAGPEDRETLLGYTDRMLRDRHWAPAISAWNALCVRGLIPYARLDTLRTASLTNGSFTADPLESGFDWRVSKLPGIDVARTADPSALRFTFSGKQPEKCDLLMEYVPVVVPSRYCLRFRFQAPAALDTGLKWRAYNAENGSELAVAPRSLTATSDWAVGDFSFSIPPSVSMVRLALTFQRMPGATRIEGALWLRDLVLQAVP